MKWRRGLLFALIHIGIAVPLIVYQEAREWRSLRSEDRITVPFRAVALQEGQIAFDPVTVCYWPTPEERVLRVVNLPAWIAAGWHNPAPSAFTLAKVAGAVYGRAYRKIEIAVSLGFIGLIFLQWLVVGALPVLRLERSFLEPSVVITLCVVVAVLALVLHYADVVIGEALFFGPLLVMLVAWFLWFVWLWVALLRAAKAGWHRHVVRA